MGKDDRTKKACMITNLKNFRRTRIRERWMCIMSKNKGLGLVSALAVGAGVAAVAAGKKYKTAETKKKEEYDALHNTSEYRNTERGKYEKNSKGIYYSNGNYEAFARPRKPEGVDDKHAYIVGSGLASLAAACFLVRDGQMPGKNIHILEAMDIAGGACDGIFDPSRGYVMRGGREMENHFECLWDLFRSIPSIETPGVSVLDEYYWLNKEDPNYSLCRATKERGKDAHTDGKFNLSQKGCMEIMKLFMTKDEDLYDKTIEDVFDDEVFNSTFWLYWRTMFAFENWHSALEMKLYFQRFIHHISGLPDFSALKFTKYNQYESLILPMQKYLEAAGVEFQFNTEVTNVLFEFEGNKKIAKAIECKVNGVEKGIVLTENDLVFVTNGSCTEGTIYGDQNHAPNGDAEVRTRDAGASGKISQNRTRLLDILRNSAPILQRQTGNLQQLPHWMTRSFLISQISANVTQEQVRLLPAVS